MIRRRKHRPRNAMGHFQSKQRHQRRRRRRHSNPSPLFLANPRHRRRRRRRGPRAIVIANPRRMRRRRRARHLYANPRHHRRMVRRRRHSNPGRLRMSNWGSWARMLLWGGAGIAVARIGGYAYTTYLAPTVIGTDATQTWRATLSEILRLFAMGASVVLIDEALRKTRLMRPQDHQAFHYAGLGETGRQAIALAIGKISPTTTLDKYGLAGYEQYAVGPSNETYGLKNGQWFLVAQPMAGLMEAENFSGLQDPSEQFSGDAEGFYTDEQAYSDVDAYHQAAGY